MIEIAFDLDDVIVDSFPVMRDEIRKKHNIVAPIEPRTFLLEKILPLTDEEIFHCVIDYLKRWKDFNLTPGAIEFLTWYYSQTGEPIKIITSRPEPVHNETLLLVDRFFDKGTVEVYFSNRGNPKWKIMDGLGVNILVEDRLKYAIEAAEHGKVVWLLDKSHNQDFMRSSHPNIIRMDGWQEVQEIYSTMKDIFGRDW